MANFEDLISSGTRAAQPAAGIEGRLYFVTDEGVIERDNGASWDAWTPDLSNIPFTPSTLADWDYASDPGDVQEALDQLAERAADLEAAGGGGGGGSSGLPPGYRYNLSGSNNGTDANNDIDIATGKIRDSGDSYDLILTSGLTKQLDASWAVGTNQGGLFSGSKASDTWYHVFLIRKDSDESIDAGFDTDIDAANIPAGYTAFARILSIKTDGSGNILPFTQVGDEFIWDTAKEDADTTASTTASLVTLSVPPDVYVLAHLRLSTPSANSQGILISSPLASDEVPSAAYNTSPVSDTGNNITDRSHLERITNAASQVRVRASGGTPLYALYTLGWKDFL